MGVYNMWDKFYMDSVLHHELVYGELRDDYVDDLSDLIREYVQKGKTRFLIKNLTDGAFLIDESTGVPLAKLIHETPIEMRVEAMLGAVKKKKWSIYARVL